MFIVTLSFLKFCLYNQISRHLCALEQYKVYFNYSYNSPSYFPPVRLCQGFFAAYHFQSIQNVILASHSYGSILARTLATEHPTDGAGAYILNAASSNLTGIQATIGAFRACAASVVDPVHSVTSSLAIYPLQKLQFVTHCTPSRTTSTLIYLQLILPVSTFSLPLYPKLPLTP